MQTKLRTYDIIPNDNICFPIGTILGVEKLYDALHFSPIFSKHKKKGLDINSLLRALISYKLTDNFSIDRAHDWINREEVLELFNLKQFNERALYRTLQTLGGKAQHGIANSRIFTSTVALYHGCAVHIVPRPKVKSKTQSDMSEGTSFLAGISTHLQI